MSKQKILLRADGNSLIGFGHLYRLLALADILKEDYHLAFALYKTSEFILNEISKYCDEIIILPGELPFKTPDEITAADEINFDLDGIIKGNEIVVLDGYYFGTNYQRQIKQRNCKLVCIDDLAINYFYADAVINHAPGIDEGIYKKEPYTKLFTGLEYAILRKPFFNPFSAAEKNNADVFISLGGSDYFQITIKLVTVLQQLGQFHTLHVMCSTSFPAEMMKGLLQMSRQSEKIKLYQNLSADEIVSLMDKCAYAFVSASTVLLEAYSRGLKCFAGYYTKNQLFIYKGFTENKYAGGLGNFSLFEQTFTSETLNRQNDLIKIVEPIQSSSNIKNIFRLI